MGCNTPTGVLLYVCVRCLSSGPFSIAGRLSTLEKKGPPEGLRRGRNSCNEQYLNWEEWSMQHPPHFTSPL